MRCRFWATLAPAVLVGCTVQESLVTQATGNTATIGGLQIELCAVSNNKVEISSRDAWAPDGKRLGSGLFASEGTFSPEISPSVRVFAVHVDSEVDADVQLVAFVPGEEQPKGPNPQVVSTKVGPQSDPPPQTVLPTPPPKRVTSIGAFVGPRQEGSLYLGVAAGEYKLVAEVDNLAIPAAPGTGERAVASGDWGSLNLRWWDGVRPERVLTASTSFPPRHCLVVMLDDGSKTVEPSKAFSVSNVVWMHAALPGAIRHVTVWKRDFKHIEFKSVAFELGHP